MEKARSMKPKSIKGILSDYLKRSNFREINETINLNASWEAVAGTPIFKNTEIISFKKGAFKDLKPIKIYAFKTS